jgi:branched-chain amino acid transport system substrate-binding protein
MSRSARARGLAPVGVALTAVLLAGCSGAQSGSGAASEGDLRLFAALPLSGPLASNGDAARVGLEAAVEVINEDGGILGREVVLTVEDSAGDSAQTAGKIQEALTGNEVPEIVYAGFTSSEAQAGLAVANQADVLAITTAAGDNLADFDRFLSSTPMGEDAYRAALAALADEGHTKVAVIVADNESGEAATRLYEEAAGEHGMEITAVERIAVDALDATAQLQRLQRGNPDAVIASMASPVIAPVLESRAKLGWDVPVLSDQMASFLPVPDMVGKDALTDFRFSVLGIGVEGSEAVSAEAMEKAIGTMEEINEGPFEVALQSGSYTYMSLMLAKYAIEEAGTTEPAEVWEARTSLTLEEMPLYSSASRLYERDGAWAWPEYTQVDFEVISPVGVEGGLIVPQD